MDSLWTNPARLRKAVIIGVWSLYALSLITPVLNDRGGAANYHAGLVPGFLALALGWIPPSTLPWSANILLLIGWVLFWRRKYFAALWLGVPAALAGLTSPWLCDSGMGRLQIGSYFWESSLILFSCGAFAVYRMESEPHRNSKTKVANHPLDE